jgi:Glycosyl transferase family 2
MICPRLSLVVEWDNARYSEIQRARTMLARTLTQVRELGLTTEILLVFDELEIDARLVKDTAEELRQEAPAHVEIHCVPTVGLRYYELKDEAARRSRGDILLFADSDILPEAGWLRALVTSFDDPGVEVVLANAYVDSDTLYGKTFALAWYFPLRSDDGAIRRTNHTFVNSIAFRRDVYWRHPFPRAREQYIGQCLSLMEALRRDGIDVYMNPSARVAHPPPTFLRSAFIRGHDAVVRDRRAGERRLRSSYWRLRTDLGGALGRIARDRDRVGLTGWWLGIAMVIAAGYYGLAFLAEVLTRVTPGLVRRLYAI